MPDRFLGGLQFPRNTTPGQPRVTEWPDIDELRHLYESGQLQMGEILSQYAGVAADDPRLEPYFAFAEELDIPVCFHTGFSEPMTLYTTDPDFRVRYNNPLLLEDVLVKHPKVTTVYCSRWISLYAGNDCAYVDVSIGLYGYIIHQLILPRQEFHDYSQRLVRLYMGKRIMYGSDQMIWPDAVGMGIEAAESAEFLSEDQKRDILYNNAVKFLRLEAQ